MPRTRKGPFRAGTPYEAAVGCDEVGYGAMCGPVVVAACRFDADAIPAELLEALDDSKKLAEAARDRLAGALTACRHVRWTLASASSRAIDRDGLRTATLAAMRRAIAAHPPEWPVVVDGTEMPRLNEEGRKARCLPRAEAEVPQVAAASILAKVVRDRVMRALHPRHPHYGWHANVGYGTAAHMAGLQAHGPSPHHRMSYAPIRALLEGRTTPH